MSDIPQGWRLVRLGECCHGKPEYGANSPSIEYSNDLPRYIRITDINDDGRLHADGKVGVILEGNEQYILQSGDFLFARSGATVGKTYLYNEDDGWALFAGYLIRFRPDERVLLSEYLKHFTQTHRYLFWVQNTLRAGAQPNINAKEYASLPIPLPPLAEQRKIAAILSTWDEAIALTERLIAALQQRKRGLMQRLLTGQVRFPGFEGEWRETQLGEFFKEVFERNKNGDDLTVLSCSKVYGIVPQSQVFDKRVASADIGNYKIVRRGDLVIDPNLLWDASLGFLEDVELGVVSPAYTVLRFKQRSGAVRRYFAYLLKTHYYREHYKFISQGTNVRRRKAPTDAFLGLRVVIGESEEQAKITEVLQQCDQQLADLAAYMDYLKMQKKGLMQRLLTGEIRVKVD